MKILRQRIGESLAKKYMNETKKKNNESENLDIVTENSNSMINI
jgi:hypothetical protein